MSIIDNIHIILNELTLVLEQVEKPSVTKLLNTILNANTIITCGAGRMGLAAKGFSMRLRQLGLDSYSLGDSSIPHVKKQDLLVVCSGSGETQTMVTIAEIAKKNGCTIALITSHKKSRIADIASVTVILPAKSKIDNKGIKSIQPMTTLMEQSTNLFLDALVLLLMKKLKKTSDFMWKKHSNLE